MYFYHHKVLYIVFSKNLIGFKSRRLDQEKRGKCLVFLTKTLEKGSDLAFFKIFTPKFFTVSPKKCCQAHPCEILFIRFGREADEVKIKAACEGGFLLTLCFR